MKAPTRVSVFIPTFNGVDRLRETVDAVLGQELPPSCELELVIIDSGSTDGTLGILESYGNRLRLYQIPNREFSHGGTRDRGARLATGEFVLFLSQDATPADRRWLVNLIEPFYLSPKVGCVYGAQWPRPEAPVTIRRQLDMAFAGRTGDIELGQTSSVAESGRGRPVDTFFSNVNSAARRDLLIGEVPFRHVSYAEDQALAQDMQERGYLKAYAPRAAVWHSNDYRFWEYYGRKRDEYLGLARSTDSPFSDSVPSLLLGWLKPTLRDWAYLCQTAAYGPAGKAVQLLLAPLYNLADKAGRHFAARQFARETATDHHGR